jgi:hypothetical protein
MSVIYLICVYYFDHSVSPPLLDEHLEHVAELDYIFLSGIYIFYQF